MMQQQDVIRFFDRAAPAWDAQQVFSEEIAGRILDGAGVGAGQTVLDVACGTGILIPRYLARQVRSVTAVDISPEMARICRQKFPLPQVRVLCADVEQAAFSERFDCVMVYNAFPHFPDPQRLLRTLSALVAPGGTLTIAHGMGRADIDRRHTGPAQNISRGLPPAEEVASWMEAFLPVRTVCDDGHMYQVTGVRPVR